MALQIQSTPGKCCQCARRCAQARKHANMCGQAQCTLGLREKTKCFSECIMNACSAHVFWIFPNRWSHTPSSFALLSYCRIQESVTRHMPLACVSFDASVSFEFISVTDACTHIQKYVLWHITICMHKAWGRKQCVSHGNTRAITKSSKCGSEILHIHLEDSHTSHCRARAILQTLCRHASFVFHATHVFLQCCHT